MRFVALVLTLALSAVAVAEEPPPGMVEVPTPPAPPASAEPAPAPPPVLMPVTPPGYRFKLVEGAPRTEKRTGVIAAGAAILGGVWLVNLQVAIPLQQYGLAVPLVGPIVEMAQLVGWSGDDAIVGWACVGLISDAAVQIGALAMAIAGATHPRHVAGAQQLMLVPTGNGVALSGRF